MTPWERALAQPEGRKRAKPGTKGEGDYFRIVVRSKEQFTTFRYHDVGEKGHILRLAGKRSSGPWDTQAWLINKDDAHIEGDTLVGDTDDARRVIEGDTLVADTDDARRVIEGDTLVGDTDDARRVIEALGSKPKHVKGDVFEAKDRPNVPESEKPTEAQQRARLANITKAQQARRTRTVGKE